MTITSKPSASPRSLNEPVLSVKGVTLEYPDGSDGVLTALDSVSLSIGPGEMHSLVGPSGSGKSSLLAVAATLISPTRGSVRIDGEEVTDLRRRRRDHIRREKIGMIFQQPNLLASLTAEEQLVMVEDFRGVSRRDAVSRAREALEVVGLSNAGQRRPHQLSGGQRQRVNIARALMGSPSVLLVDEPTAALDHDRSESIVRLLRRLTDEMGLATLMVTHDTDFVPLTDVVVTMRDGVLSDPVRTKTAAGPALSD
ncbi:ABC transporter ATP-binding protein [Nesterenkonia muleiensis]|uniref:ABC transporter ATP-binding protein n=1 Tax=Nesterenkonia muleiensis TaxID=2282648 RepID=UPI000E73DF8E|nr:ABC transporter ATP-binding protein [Nesterenkonia muleiensis]